MSKKSEGTPKSPKSLPPAESPQVDAVEDQLAPAIEPEPVKAKPEPSRLRSSWDAVAQFFGVATPEPTPEPVTPPPSNVIEPSPASRPVSNNKRSKPSMWASPVEEPASVESEPETGFAPPARSETREPRDAGPRRGARDRKPRNEDVRPARTTPVRNDEIDLDEDRDVLPVVDQPETRGRRTPPTHRDERGEPLDPDRRSTRRPPRRGRAAAEATPIDDVDEEVPFVEDTELPVEDRKDHRREPSRESGRGRGRRDGGRGPAPASDRTASDRISDRPVRESERNDRSERPERGNRHDRSRPSRDDRGPRDSSREHVARDTGGRTSHRDRDDRRPAAAPKPVKSAGFGAGVHDDFDFPDEPSVDRSEFEIIEDIDSEPVAEKSEPSKDREDRPKRRRGRGRGRGRGERAPGDDADRSVSSSSEEVEEAELVSRHTKIPSWQDAIGTLVATNMENHQKNPNQGRGPRGRGPRRDR